MWEVDKKSGAMTRVNKKRGLDTELLDPALETQRNNAQLYDRNESQKLTQEQITALKASGEASSDQIVDMLIENSATFASKTEFSQEKYIKKKKAKHGTDVTVHPLTLARLAETFWERDSRKIRGMRPDTVAMVMSMANIHAGVNSLVVENCSGLLLGSLLYRQQGLGYVVHAFENNQKRTEGVKRFNFPPEVHSALLQIPLEKLLDGSVPVVSGASAAKSSAAKSSAAEEAKEQKSDKDVEMATETPSAPASAPAPVDCTAETILSHQVDVILLATRYDPFPLLLALWPYLKPAGRFVVFDDVLESLSNTHARLSAADSGLGDEAPVNLTLTECFFRDLQVLPNRTHPFVNMSASGGYLLAGQKLAAKQNATK